MCLILQLKALRQRPFTREDYLGKVFLEPDTSGTHLIAVILGTADAAALCSQLEFEWDPDRVPYDVYPQIVHRARQDLSSRFRWRYLCVV